MAQIDETELDVRALAGALWRKAWLLALLTVVAAVATYVGLGFVAPLYTADTRILIEERESPLTRPREGSNVPSTDFDASAIQSQVEVLRSREIADAVIDKLDLTRRPEFDPARRPSLIRSLLVMVGLGEAPTDSTIRQRVMESYFTRLSVYPLQQSRVVGVDFSAPSPNLAAEVANAVADSFVELQQSAKRESAVAATDWLRQEIDRLRARVSEAEQAVADYRARQGLFNVEQGGTGDGNLSTQQLGDINAELARARAARAEAEARASLVESMLQEGGPIDASQEVLNSQLIQRLRERQGALQAQIAELSTTLLPTHPRIRSLEGQVANLEGQIRDEAGKVLASLQTAARVAAAREGSLVTSLNLAKSDVSRSNDQGIELRALEREATAQRDLLESFLSRYREAAARTDAGYLPADARIISRAVAPTAPSFPKKKMMAVAAAVATLLIVSAILLLREFMSGRAFRIIGNAEEAAEPAPLKPLAGDEEDVRSVSVAPSAKPQKAPPATSTVAEVGGDDDEPKVHPAETMPAPESETMSVAVEVAEVAESAPTSVEIVDEETLEEKEAEWLSREPSAENLHELPVDRVEAPEPEAGAPAAKPSVPAEEVVRNEEQAGATGLAEIVASPSVRIALFAGAEGGEGAGAIAFSAAREAARQKVRCVVIDVGREPSESLGFDRPGLADLLAGDASFGEVIQRDDTARVHVIPVGSIEKNPPFQRMQLVIGALTHTYDKVIVVADKIDDWPDEFVRPDIAAIVCGAETTESLRTEVYDVALARGAHSAVIVRFSDFDLGGEASAAA